MWGSICRALPNAFRHCKDPFGLLFDSFPRIYDAFKNAFICRVFSSALLTSLQRTKYLVQQAPNFQNKVVELFKSIKETIDPLIIALFVEIFALPNQQQQFKFQLEQSVNSPLSQLAQECQKMNLKGAKRFMLSTLEGKYQDIIKAFMSMSRNKLVPFILVVCTDLVKSLAEVNKI